jgi:hypothetical protein
MKTFKDTLQSFADKNGYEYWCEGNFMYLETTNDIFRFLRDELIHPANSNKEFRIWHANGGARWGWHKQGNHPWKLRQAERFIWNHDRKLGVSKGKWKVVIPKQTEMLYGDEE